MAARIQAVLTVHMFALTQIITNSLFKIRQQVVSIRFLCGVSALQRHLADLMDEYNVGAQGSSIRARHSRLSSSSSKHFSNGTLQNLYKRKGIIIPIEMLYSKLIDLYQTDGVMNERINCEDDHECII
jgi:hypothetical protein